MKKSLKKSDKLRLFSEFERLKKDGEKLVGKYFILVSADAPDGLLRCGVICSKKYSNLAVVRNAARRKMWESFRLLKPFLKKRHLLLIARMRLKECRRQEVTMELWQLAQKAQMLEKQATPSQLEC